MTEAQYQEVLEALGKPRRLAELAATDWFRRAKQTAQRDDFRPFHWELEFPEVFLRRGRPAARRRFRRGHWQPALRRALGAGKRAEPGRSSGVHRPRARSIGPPSAARTTSTSSSFAAPWISWPKAATSASLRRWPSWATIRRPTSAGIWSASARFTGIEAFPQKDDPSKRVFPEAKLSTAVFGMTKGESPLRFRCPRPPRR